MFAFDEEHIAQVRTILRREKLELSAAVFRKLTTRTEEVANAYLSSKDEPEPDNRVIFDQLRHIWLLAVETDPRVGQIRALIARLPNKAIKKIDTIAQHVRAIVVANEQAARRARGSISRPECTKLNGYDGDFREWARTAPKGDLLWAVGALFTTGSSVAPGRSRGKGKRSASRVEPRIMGKVRGQATSAPRRGRPVKAALHDLVARLVDAWIAATGQTVADISRTDHHGCGDLVHSVCQWLGIRRGEAEYALRKLVQEME